MSWERFTEHLAGFALCALTVGVVIITLVRYAFWIWGQHP